jgi:sugar/nucleoside kinase (ribokinase family)
MKMVCVGLLNVDEISSDGLTSEQAGGNLSHVAAALRSVAFNNAEIGFVARTGPDFPATDTLRGYDQSGVSVRDVPSTRVRFRRKGGMLRFSELSPMETDPTPLQLPSAYANSRSIVAGAVPERDLASVLSRSACIPIVTLNFSAWSDPPAHFELVRRYATFFVLNRGEASRHFHTEDPRELADRCALPSTAIIITRDEDGFVFSHGERYIRGEAPRVTPTWQYGAGAIFAALLTLKLAEGEEITRALSQACALASLYVEYGPMKAVDPKLFYEASDHVFNGIR